MTRRSRGPHSEATKEKIRQANLRTWSSAELRSSHSTIMKGKPKSPASPEYRERCRQRGKEKDLPENLVAYWQNPENKKRQSARLTERFSDPAEREKLSKKVSVAMNSLEVKRKCSDSAKLRLQRPEEKQRLEEVAARGRATLQTSSPTSLERAVMEVLDAEGIPYHFQFPIGPYLADFVVGNIVLEADGEYWHQDQARQRQRDGYLKSQGFVVKHILGAEIQSDCKGAVERALQL